MENTASVLALRHPHRVLRIENAGAAGDVVAVERGAGGKVAGGVQQLMLDQLRRCCWAQ